MPTFALLSPVIYSLALAGSDAGFKPGVEGQRGFGPPVVSEDGTRIALTRWDRIGLETVEFGSGVRTVVSTARGAGFAPDWDEYSLVFKEVRGDGRQAAVQWAGGKASILLEGNRVSQPIAHKGRLFGARRTLEARPHALLELVDAGDVDLVGVSSDFRRQVWNDDRGQLHIRQSDGSVLLADLGGRGTRPSFSGSGELVVHATDGIVRVVRAETGLLVASMPGSHPVWMPGTETLIFDRVVTGSDVGPDSAESPYQVIESSLWNWTKADGSRPILANAALHPRWPTVTEGGEIYFVDSIDGALWRLKNGEPTRVLTSTDSGPAGAPPPVFGSYAHEVPYMHQLWDTPDDFDGGWSCGATSVLQTMARYEILPNADITASWPTPHISHWGWYVPNVYSFNGYTYDTWGVAASADCQGAHGFICRQYGGAVWAYLTQFAQQHGMASEQIGTNYTDLVREIDAGYTMYVSADVLGFGHIMAVTGYLTNDDGWIHSMVVNDPYGNAGSGDWGNFDGKAVTYDWPGYNNGHLEIEVAQLFTARGTMPVVVEEPPVVTDEPADTGSVPEIEDSAVPTDEKPPRSGEASFGPAMPGDSKPLETVGLCSVATGSGIWSVALAGVLIRRRRKSA